MKIQNEKHQNAKFIGEKLKTKGLMFVVKFKKEYFPRKLHEEKLAGLKVLKKE